MQMFFFCMCSTKKESHVMLLSDQLEISTGVAQGQDLCFHSSVSFDSKKAFSVFVLEVPH